MCIVYLPLRIQINVKHFIHLKSEILLGSMLLYTKVTLKFNVLHVHYYMYIKICVGECGGAEHLSINFYL